MTTIRLHDVCVAFPATDSIQDPIGTAVGHVFGGRKRAVEIGITTGTSATFQAGIVPARQWLLDHINLEIRHGETMGILGPSGCGKTTLLRAIAGLTPINSGLILYDDQDMAVIPPKERGIGIVFQNYALYPTMTSQENVGFFFRMHKRTEEIPERIRYVSEVMGIGFKELLDKRPAWLSGGQRQRVALARCIARDPKLFLFDEPLSNLDAKLRVKTRSELKRLITRYKVTGVYVTHDQSEALALCDRLAIMNDGHIEQVGTAQYLLEHPLTTMVATFLGTPPMNLFEGELVEGQWRNNEFSVPLGRESFAPRKNVTLGVRGEHLVLDSNGPLRGEVTLIEPLLSERTLLVYIEHNGAKLVALLPQDANIQRGEVIGVSVNPSSIHLFDTNSGRRL